MLFNVIFSEPNEQLLISGNSWSSCLAYCEGTGKNIGSISTTSNAVIVNNPSSTICFVVTLKDDTNGEVSAFQIFDTYQNVINWVNTQVGKSLQTLNKQNKQFVAI